jgi:adenine-specific DNA-methyltransferase
LFGHPNLYGLFTQLAIEHTVKNGIIAYLTPTSFLSGEYFKNLRQFIRRETTLKEVDFIEGRKGVFEDVLQEAMLAVYEKGVDKSGRIKVNQITFTNGVANLANLGSFSINGSDQSPWILPRSLKQSLAVNAMSKMSHTLADWGYRVSTGPLVWNRHKGQLKNNPAKNTFPLIWAEAVTQDGQFILKSDKRNHTPFFQWQEGDEWLITTKSCILLQRTTAKEQEKRLIAATLPENLVSEYGGVVVENHLNMIVPVNGHPAVSLPVVADFLNSKIVNEAFRSISGSVAVSAYELEAFPLPAPEDLRQEVPLEQVLYKLYHG